jgi:SH3-like domain-containing protein
MHPMPMNSARIVLAYAICLMVSISFFCTPAPSLAAERTGLPLPRFDSLRADLVNLRTGPGVQYPIEWVYQRQNLPVEIIAEYRTWLKIRDWQSTQGWVHQSMLSGRRSVIVTGKRRSLRSSADTKSPPVAEIEAGAIAHLDKCPSGGGWCFVEAESLKGWLRKVEFWGAYRNEVLK